jgi:peptide-methionine (R)-S-oxide reductase
VQKFFGSFFQKRTACFLPVALPIFIQINEEAPMADAEFPLSKPDAEWQRELTPEQFRVLRQHGTERPGASPLNAEKRAGQFFCAACEAALFDSSTKYESGSGWPSFYAPLEGAVGTTEDRSLGMRRVEVHCARCGGHLGHVFPDGPRPTGDRYCMNGAALKFKPE